MEQGDLIADYVLIPASKPEFSFPFNLTYNYNTQKYQPCLVILFLYVRTNHKDYPILFDYWINELGYQDKEEYLSKNDIFLKALDFVIDQGLKFNYLIFDSGFCKSNVIDYLQKKKIKYVSRLAKNKLVGNLRVDTCFDDYNGDFYYYHKKRSFLRSKDFHVYGQDSRVVAIASSKEKLIYKDLVFLITNDLTLTHVEIQRLYKSRWCIEIFFKILKSYLSLSTFYRHDLKSVNEKINLALSAYFVVQELCSKLNKKFYQVLRLIQRSKIDKLLIKTIKKSSNIIYNYVSEDVYVKTY